jgi:Tol biopolymer transport system component
VAFELTTKGGPYPNIAIMQLATSKVTSVTENRSPDRFPLFTPDGRRVVFEARNIDPVFGRRRAVVRIASVDAPRDE